MKIQTLFARKENYGGKRTKPIKYLVIHFTGGADTAKANAIYFNRDIVGVSAHYFVDEKEVWQSVEDMSIGWHCGGSKYYHPECRNANSIGIEISMIDKNGNVRHKSIAMAIKLTRMLMEKYNIDKDHVVRHYDVTHKICPAPMVKNPSMWQDFLNALEGDEEDMDVNRFEELWKEYRKTLQDNDAAAWSKEAREWSVNTGLIAGGSTGEPNYMWEDVLTREQMAVLLYRFAQMMGKA